MFIMFRLPLLLLLTYKLCVIEGGVSMLGPVDLVFQRMEHCEPDVHIVDFWASQKKFNRTAYILDFTVTTPYPIDDSVTLELKGSMKKEGGYKPGALYFKDQACTALHKMLGDIFDDILKISGTEECPLPAGTHKVLDYFFDNEEFVVPQLYGEYKMEAFLYKDEELQSCYVVYYELVPKTRK